MRQLLLYLAIFLTLTGFSQDTTKTTLSKSSAPLSLDSIWSFSPFSVNISTGIWMPLGKLSEYYNPCFQLGFGFGFKISRKIRFDIGLVPRFLNNKKNIAVKVNNTILEGKTPTSGSIGGWATFALFKNKYLFTEFISGLHYEPLSTNIVAPTSNDTVSISTWGISFGMNTWINIFRKQNFGIKLLYNYAPYNQDKKLISNIGGHFASVSLCYKFPKRDPYYRKYYDKNRSRNNTIFPFYIPTKAPTIPENNIAKEIPKYPNGKLFTYYILAKQRQQQLGLSIPENGHDSLLIRMWFTYPESLHQFAELVELRIDSNKTVTAKYTMLNIFFNPSRRYEVINWHWDTIVTPKCGWPAFMDTLSKLEITKLPTIEFLPKYIEINGKDNYDYGNNLLTVSVEVATKNEYRFFQYNNLKKYKDIDEVNRMYRFERFQREQLGLRQNDDGWY